MVNFLDFDTLAKIDENGCTRKKNDIRYVMDICVFRLNQLLFQNYWKLSLTILTYFGNMLEANFNQQKFKLKIRCSVNLWGECKHYKPKLVPGIFIKRYRKRPKTTRRNFDLRCKISFFLNKNVSFLKILQCYYYVDRNIAVTSIS